MKLPALFRNRDYMLLWSGQVVSTLGSSASYVVYPLLILAMTGSPAAAGIAAALGNLPYLLFSLPAGALIDRWDRKRAMISCDVGRALAVASIAIALWLDVLTVWQLYIASFIEGSFFVFFNIAEVAALPRVVPKDELPQASAQNEAAFAAAHIVGPSFGTLLYQGLGRAAPFVADAISYVVSIVSLMLIRTPFRAARPAQAKTNLRGEIGEGLRWLWGQPLIRYMAFLTGSINLVNAGTGLVVILLAQDLGARPVDIGLIFSIGGIGGILGSLIGGRVQKRFSFRQAIIALMWIEALLFPLYAIVPQYLLLGVVFALIYFIGPIYNVVQFSYRLALIPDALQGRVNSTFRLLAFGMMPIGAALSGFLIERLGVIPAVVVFSLWYVLLAIMTTLNRHVREARPLEQLASV
ncbi:MAG: MFS transporter [Betaproteobacteria bacterium]|nr:MAG: MFS transporter [Betaproteobacteria bacterium]